ncbi:MAG: hypothetical protein M3Y53_04555 [Thermoproteota archaeon]|nr:hypothetical protein [Thermoproteota archaeon]
MKFIIVTMVDSVLVVVWHYEYHQLINEIRERLRQKQLRREEQDRIIGDYNGNKEAPIQSSLVK